MEYDKNQRILAELWGDFVDCKKRREGENGWLIEQLNKYNCKEIFESSLGVGCDSIYLQKNGFDVTSNEIDKSWLKKAIQSAKKEKVKLKITNLDWRKLTTKIKKESFDAALCLGNSLTYMFTHSEQTRALQQLRFILRPKGILIIDERNYQYILDNRKEILGGNFRYSGKYVYCGETVHGKPIEITNDYVKFQYTDERTGKKGYLVLYPFKKGYLKKILKEAGFKKIEQFSDYKKGCRKSADFYQYVCIK